MEARASWGASTIVDLGAYLEASTLVEPGTTFEVTTTMELEAYLKALATSLGHL